MKQLILLCLGLLAGQLWADAQGYARVSPRGAVATVHPLATGAAMAVLENGGNAADAAVAAALTLGVVDGHNSGLGGGNFALVRWADGKVQALDGRERAPALAHRDMYLREGKANSDLSRTGALAAGVPGSLLVYDYLLRRGGTTTLAPLLKTAADLADKGFPLNQVSVDRLQMAAAKIRQFPATAKILLNAQGEPWQVGHVFKQPELAATYRAIAEYGADWFYLGDYPKAVEAWMLANGGVMRAQDFADYHLAVREPLVTQYRGYTVYGFPPPSSGGLHVTQMLAMLETFDVASLAPADRAQLLAEVMKRAFADRAHWLGDPDFSPVPLGLVDTAYLRQRAASIDLKKASGDVQPGQPPKADSELFRAIQGTHTTHIAAADVQGNWVAITTTVNTSWGSGVMIPGTGLILNNQMDDFSAQPGVPNAFGLVGSEANSVQPGKRPLSSMSPTLVLKEGKPVLTVGAAGGPTIISQVVQALVNVLDLGMAADAALGAPRLHHQWQPPLLFVDMAIDPAVREALVARGQAVKDSPFSGSSQMIRLTTQGNFDAASEPRIIQRNQQGPGEGAYP